MGFKTVTFTNKIEQRTYVHGKFTGKYHGVLNIVQLYSKFDNYDIHIYEGEIDSFKNEKEHPKVINETIYNAIISETQLTQSIFENVLVKIESSIGNYDSFKLAIKGPKLESVQIFDVEKDGNQTFGTLTCLVSGYLLKTSIETSEMAVETCDGCGQFLTECICNGKKPPLKINITKDPPINVDNPPVTEVKESFWAKRSHWWKNSRKSESLLGNTSSSYFGLLGLLLGAFILISYGFSGLLIGIAILLIYALSSLLRRTFPSLLIGLRSLLYTLLGLIFLGWLFQVFLGRSQINTSIITHKNETPNTQNASTKQGAIPEQDDITVSQESYDSNSQIFKDEIDTSLVENEIPKIQVPDEHDAIPVLPSQGSVGASGDSSAQKNTILVQDILVNSSQENSESKNYESTNTSLEVANSSNEESVNPQNEELNNASPLYQVSTEYSTQESEKRKKQNKVIEIISGIEFHEGDVYICKGESSTRYHLKPDCIGLSNCSTPIYRINIPAAERMGHTLCELEERLNKNQE